jgi:hypothetical protein
MKKLLLLASFICLFAVSSQAQYQKGDFILSAGLGVGYYYAGGGASLLINGEYFVLDKLSVGGYFGYTSWNYGAGNDYKLNFIDFGARGSYHFSELFGITNENLDIYGGAQLGYLVSSWSGPGGSFLDDAGYGGGVRAGIHAGARYFFTPKFGAYGEIGAGYSPLAFGVTFKF